VFFYLVTCDLEILKPLLISRLDCISAHLVTIMPYYVEAIVAWFVVTRTYLLPNKFRELSHRVTE
jgi:hypothetical protein